MRPALTWRALDGDLVAGEVRARLRPDNRWFLYFDTWRADAYPPLADAVARDLGGDLYVTLEDAEYDALDACAQAGFAVHRRESYYRIPADRAVAGLAGAHVIRLVASFANSGALLSDGQYFNWGYNADGQLGNGQGIVGLRVNHNLDVHVGDLTIAKK